METCSLISTRGGERNCGGGGRCEERVRSRMGLSQEEMQLLEYAGLLHDVGKIGCAEEAWQKPGKLDNGEMAEMKKHCYVSSQILKSISFLKETAPWVYHHQDRKSTRL